MTRPRRTLRDQILAETRQRLLEAAASEFAREGYTGANINRISQAAGFAKGTVYNHFPSKQALMLALIDETAATHIEYILQHLDLEGDPARRLECFFKVGFAFVEHHSSQVQVIVNVVYGPDGEFKTRVYQAYARLFKLITQDILKVGLARGDFAAMNLDLATALIMTVYLGSYSQLNENGKVWLDSGKVVKFVLDGLRVRTTAKSKTRSGSRRR